jgi:hypothetical protein
MRYITLFKICDNIINITKNSNFSIYIFIFIDSDFSFFYLLSIIIFSRTFRISKKRYFTVIKNERQPVQRVGFNFFLIET